MSELTDRGKAFRSTITAFIEARHEAKLKGKDDEDAGTASKYDYETWLASAAERARYLQSVTHVLKATHPSAKGSNTYVIPMEMPDRPEIGTHSVGQEFTEDTAVADAKHLDVYALLKQPVEGRRILDWVREDDPDLRDALHPEPSIAQKWIDAFKDLVRSDDEPVSHELAKQLYWMAGETPTNDGDYHLLQPMFPSSLVHVIHKDINDSFWKEPNKSARKARWDKKASDESFKDYRNVVARKLGGTKPQNISQLNSERGGVNYLLASLPPTWETEHPRKLLQLESAMDRLAYFKGVHNQVKALADFLLRNPPANDQTRTTRKEMEQELGAQLALFAAETWARFEPGWTRSPECELPLCEKLWLDPERAELPVRDDPDHLEQADDDRQFKAAYEFGDWPDEVAARFANWVNQRLRDAGLVTMGDAEYRHWAKQAIVDAAWPVPMQRRAPTGGGA